MHFNTWTKHFTNQKRSKWILGILSLVLISCGYQKEDEKPVTESAIVEKPNVILILADDMGWSDLGCYGSEVNTPNLDRLAS